jgi:hypothetical protein
MKPEVCSPKPDLGFFDGDAAYLFKKGASKLFIADTGKLAAATAAS